jgi:hypothetical protein
MKLNRLAPALVAVLALAAPARAADPAAARRYLEGGGVPRMALSYMHATATFKGMDYVDQTGVNDGSGRPIPGQFALHYRFRWVGLFDNANSTDACFLFDERGRLYDVQATRTTSVFKPFEGADVIIGLVKDALIAEIDRGKDDEAKKLVRDLIARADARGLLTLVLRVRQP